MSQLQSILKYQAVDSKLFKLENAIKESEERKKYVKFRTFLKTAPEKLEAYEQKAAALKGDAAAITAKYEQVEATLKEFENLEDLMKDGADVSFLKKKAQSIMEQLKKLRADLTAITANVKALDEEYQDLKKKVIAAQKQYAAAEKAYEELKASKTEEKNAIQAELNEIAKELDSNLLARYQTKRKEIDFPFVVEASGSGCSFCGSGFSVVDRNNLSNGVDCEMCKKIVFGS